MTHFPCNFNFKCWISLATIYIIFTDTHIHSHTQSPKIILVRVTNNWCSLSFTVLLLFDAIRKTNANKQQQQKKTRNCNFSRHNSLYGLNGPQHIHFMHTYTYIYIYTSLVMCMYVFSSYVIS